MQDQLDEQTDRSLRSNITLIGLPQSPDEKTWDDTSKAVSLCLANETKQPAEHFYHSIERAHRMRRRSTDSATAPAIIECKFMDWRVAEEVRTIFRKKRDDNITYHDKYSKNTQARVVKCLIKRKELRGSEEYGDWKLYVKYSAKLMGKPPNTNKYHVIEEF